MTTASEAFKAGKLADATAAAIEQVRNNPADRGKRFFLAELFVFAGDLERADKQLEELAHEHPVCQRLMSIPGVGPVTSHRFVAALDKIDRFPNAHSVQSYLGLVPGEDSSATRKRRTGITKAGPAPVRRTLTQAAWVLRNAPRRRLDPLVLWAIEVEKRRGKQIAITALARRLAGVMYAIWRDGTRYEPARSVRRDIP